MSAPSVAESFTCAVVATLLVVVSVWAIFADDPLWFALTLLGATLVVLAWAVSLPIRQRRAARQRSSGGAL